LSTWFVQGQVGHHPLQPAILIRELAEPPAPLVDLEPGVLGLPPVVRFLADAMAAADIPWLGSGVGLLQDPDDLLLPEPPSPHGGVLPAG
jgi:hypothetical protein